MTPPSIAPSGRRRVLPGALVTLVALLLAGCSQQELYSQLSERQANEMVAVLQSAGIDADKQVRDGQFSVRTASADFPTAVRTLSAQGYPDSQDYQGTSVTVEVARKLDVPNMFMIVNKAPPSFDENELKKRIESTYRVPVAAVIPHSDEMMALASSGIFSLRYPDHPVAQKYRDVVALIKG
jgi:hypothetical protein